MYTEKEHSLKSFLTRVKLTVIGGYTFQRILPGGGTNFTALYCKNDQQAVAKFFFIGPHEVMEKKFRNEVDNHSQSRKLTLVMPEIYTEFSSDDGFIKGYLMEYVSGTSLDKLISGNEFSDQNEVIAAFYRIAWACHQTLSGLVHGDMHPGNIVFETDMKDWLSRKPDSPEVRILDLGASIAPFNFGYDETFDESLWHDFRRRYSGSFHSLAPEFFTATYNRSIQSPGTFDCWGLGLLLYKMHTGKFLNVAESVGEYVELIHKNELQQKIDQQIDKNCQEYHLRILILAMLRVDVSRRIKLSTATAYAGQLYNKDKNLIGKKDADLYNYIYHDSCDPEAGLPPHERSDSPY